MIIMKFKFGNCFNPRAVEWNSIDFWLNSLFRFWVTTFCFRGFSNGKRLPIWCTLCQSRSYQILMHRIEGITYRFGRVWPFESVYQHWDPHIQTLNFDGASPHSPCTARQSVGKRSLVSGDHPENGQLSIRVTDGVNSQETRQWLIAI